ncbi:MAG: alpha/beta hydrolase [Lachnospiraceae bacterium]|nr:alpha/beta hydrolase [Lachnospiraceae bacterium]
MEKSREDEYVIRDGFKYLSAEAQADFVKKTVPGAFDTNKVKNRILDIQYGTLPEQKLDLYLPEGKDGPYPVLIHVHGGGWMFGSKTECFLEPLLEARRYGYAVISVDYRLFPAVQFPENLFDVKTAIRWTRANAERYNLDASKIGMIGDSAGGHLSLMAGFTSGHPEYAGAQYGWGEYSDEVQAVCDLFGPAVLDDFADTFFRESGVPRVQFADGMDMIALAFGQDKNLLKLISPVSYISASIPPTLILQGKMDGIVAYQNSTLLYERIVEVCGEGKAELLLYEDRVHEDPAFYENGALCKAVIPFFDRYLK